MGGVGGLGGSVRRGLATSGPAIALVGVQLVVFPMPLGAWVRGVVIGLLVALLAIGLALVYRANRVINFAQADLGFVPTSLAVGIIVFWGWSYWIGLAVGLAAAVLLGAAVELLIIRRFRDSPRLILTVATIGLMQLLWVLAVVVPRWWGKSAASQRIPSPIDVTWEIGSFVLGGNDLVALVVAPITMVAVAWFLGRTRLGLAVRAAAERRDRAASLGVPIARLATVVWSMAAALSFVALFLRAGILGVPLGSALTVSALMQALAALVIGRLTNLPTVALSAVALGVLEYGVTWNEDSPLLTAPIMAAAVLVSLLVQRRDTSRRDPESTASWSAAEEVRPLPAEVAAQPVVRLIRWGLVTVGVAAILVLPSLLRVDQLTKVNAIVVFAIVGVSLVVLTGWSGQISLGQMAFVAVGAAVSAWCTLRWAMDLTLSLVVAGVAGAVSALVIGLPALRLRGLYLAVTTLAFALAVSSWLLNERFFDWVPVERVERPPLFGRIDLDGATAYYFFTLMVFALVVVGVRGIRHSRTGRAILATRDNERAAQSFAIGTTRAKLTAFVTSGAIAGVAGGLLVHLTHSFELATYGPGDSLDVFIATVVGGLGSIGGAVLGAVYLRGARWFITAPEWRFLASAVGVLLVLLLAPGGLMSLVVRLRDLAVQRLTGRHVITAAAPEAPPAAPAGSGTEQTHEVPA